MVNMIASQPLLLAFLRPVASAERNAHTEMVDRTTIAAHGASASKRHSWDGKSLVGGMSICRGRYNCRVRSAVCVGRIGGLAVALGAGSVLFTSKGIASAEGGEPRSGTRTTSTKRLFLNSRPTSPPAANESGRVSNVEATRRVADEKQTVSVQAADQSLVAEERTLVLTAFPAEADAILARTALDPNPSVVVDGRHYYRGTLGGKKVIVAMTGIGMENATQTTRTALEHFTAESGISVNAVVFSGVAGGSGRTEIGSVAVPARWTSDDGATWHAVDAGMLAAANTVTVDLLSTDSIGDPACRICPLARFPLINLRREPQLFVGGDGSSDDNNNGVAFPAIPFGGAVFGPQPLAAPDRSPLFFGNFFRAVGPFLARGLVSNLTGILTDVPPAVDAVDQETAAAQAVADTYGVPFLGIRGMSDGPGDPLNLPGYPFTFYVYKQIAADNAAIVTEAFLQNCDGG
jgi:nucleoside phosphorylase